MKGNAGSGAGSHQAVPARWRRSPAEALWCSEGQMEINGNRAATTLAHNLFMYLVMLATINR